MLYVFNKNNQVQIAWNGKISNSNAPRVPEWRNR